MADPTAANQPALGLPWLNTVIAGLGQANVAIPLIFSTVTGMVQLYRAAHGQPALTPTELFTIADLIEAQVKTNDAYGREEIARLTLLVTQA